MSDNDEPLNIVILGASYAGIAAAHGILTTLLSSDTTTAITTNNGPKKLTKKGPSLLLSPQSHPLLRPYRVVLISPSTHFYYNVAAPRALASRHVTPVDDCFVEIEPAFEKYGEEKFSFVEGKCTGLDSVSRMVTVTTNEWVRIKSEDDGHGSTTNNDGNHASAHSDDEGNDLPGSSSHSPKFGFGTRTIPYHALIIASGTSTPSPFLSTQGSHLQTLSRLLVSRLRLSLASSVLIVGGGPSGVEVAGQIARTHNQPSWWRSLIPRGIRYGNKGRPRTFKKITLVSGHERLLPNLPAEMGYKAERLLKSMCVKVVHRTRLINTVESTVNGRITARFAGVGNGNDNDKDNCAIDDKHTIYADLYIPATGVTPNTSFLPRSSLNSKGYVITDPEYLRVYDIGERIYALGDCAAYSRGNFADVYAAAPVLVRNLGCDLRDYQEMMMSQPFLNAHGFSYGSGEDASITVAPPHPTRLVDESDRRREDAFYDQDETDTAIIPITKRGGVGIVKGRKIPGWAVHWLKGRDYRIKFATGVVWKGQCPDGLIKGEK